MFLAICILQKICLSFHEDFSLIHLVQQASIEAFILIKKLYAISVTAVTQNEIVATFGYVVLNLMQEETVYKQTSKKHNLESFLSCVTK